MLWGQPDWPGSVRGALQPPPSVAFLMPEVGLRLTFNALHAQIRHGLDAEQLRRGRKRKSESGLRDWTEAEDIQLLKVVWSGARGEDRCTPTRTASACRQRLQLIRKHVELSTRNSLGMSSTNP